MLNGTPNNNYNERSLPIHNLSQQQKGSKGELFETSKDEFFETRYQTLLSFFQELNINMTDYLPEKDLLHLLDSLTAHEFDREIARGLFSKIPKIFNPDRPYEKVLEVQEFVYTFIKAEYLLLMKAEEVDRNLNDIAEKIEALHKHIKALKTNTIVDGQEVSLTLEVAEVVSNDLDREDPPHTRYSAVVRYETYKYETEEVTNKGMEFNPHFDHTFHIKIRNLRDKIKISLRKYDNLKNRMAYSESTANFAFDLADKSRNEAWIELYDADRRYTKEKMHITVALEANNTHGIDYYLNSIEQLEVHEEKLIGERELIYKSLADLVEPFSIRAQESTFPTTTPILDLPMTDIRDDGEVKANRVSVSHPRPSKS